MVSRMACGFCSTGIKSLLNFGANFLARQKRDRPTRTRSVSCTRERRTPFASQKSIIALMYMYNLEPTHSHRYLNRRSF